MKSNEINDLFDYGYHIVQNDDYFKFSIDSVLLAEFVSLKKGKNKILDMCSGNVPVPMILYKKYGNDINITAVELQKEIYCLGIESLKINKIDCVNYINADIKDLPNIIKYKFDIITCNPPYYKVSNIDYINDNNVKAIARHELKATLEDSIKIASKLINNQGYFYIVHRPERVADIINLLHKYHFGVKNIQTVFDDKNSKASIILIESVYNGADYVIINPPLFIKEHSSYKDIFKR